MKKELVWKYTEELMQYFKSQNIYRYYLYTLFPLLIFKNKALRNKAIDYLRTKHGFSEKEAQHIFESAVMQGLFSSGIITNIPLVATVVLRAILVIVILIVWTLWAVPITNPTITFWFILFLIFILCCVAWIFYIIYFSKVSVKN